MATVFKSVEDLLDAVKQLQRAEQLDATRVVALAELARRRKQSVSQIKKSIGWREKRHGT